MSFPTVSWFIEEIFKAKLALSLQITFSGSYLFSKCDLMILHSLVSSWMLLRWNILTTCRYFSFSQSKGWSELLSLPILEPFIPFLVGKTIKKKHPSLFGLLVSVLTYGYWTKKKITLAFFPLCEYNVLSNSRSLSTLEDKALCVSEKVQKADIG